MKQRLLQFVIGMLGLGLSGAASIAMALPSLPEKGHITQRLNAFDNPESAVFSADGRYVFVSNAPGLGVSDKATRVTEHTGFISKLAVQPSDTLRMLDRKFITGLTAPHGMAASTVATPKFPRGTIFLCEGGVPIAQADGSPVSDPNRPHPQLIAFDADGHVLGRIGMGWGSPFEKLSGSPATFPNGITFDQEGNLYVSDSGAGGDGFLPPIRTSPGIYMIPRTSLDALADGNDAAIHFIGMPGAPGGVQVAPDGSINVNTVGNAIGFDDPAEGGMYRLDKTNFVTGTLPPPIATGLAALDGLTFAGRVRLDTEILGNAAVVVTPPGKAPMRLGYNHRITLAGPADIAIRRQPDGHYLLLIPERSALTPQQGRDPLTVVELPKNFNQL